MAALMAASIATLPLRLQLLATCKDRIPHEIDPLAAARDMMSAVTAFISAPAIVEALPSIAVAYPCHTA